MPPLLQSGVSRPAFGYKVDDDNDDDSLKGLSRILLCRPSVVFERHSVHL